MKKSLLLIPLIIISCKKEANVTEVPGKDSTIVSEMPDSAYKADSIALRKKDSIINNAPATKEVLQKGVMRSEKEGQVIRTADASQLPFTLGEEFTKDGQELVLKLTNYNQPNIKAKILTKEKDFNIRFNQIKLPNGDYDGPFSRDITYETPGKGEVWLIIGKSNMASGNTKGSFTVSVE
ncbi:hypothetical protein C1637_24410 [Chryseobacterium lactis]|uniref:Lipoprotein n=1 Tax=Chryseobacterium lactis TaxID=1241981 RepID=A0A3G6RQS9_CHRLC|nr:hypothetical protein [Chryseobacterium lactis]AZA85103.1 hypothetical protein EG342_08860 [Chryseobacterium lactis]AZB07331.1 hypothetical protein EG341_24975 [Chryseobacterium lactis]PNW11093.1 hypothetical protein C1637_24410 [Chryseobacterium lactis]